MQAVTRLRPTLFALVPSADSFDSAVSDRDVMGTPSKPKSSFRSDISQTSTTARVSGGGPVPSLPLRGLVQASRTEDPRPDPRAVSSVVDFLETGVDSVDAVLNDASRARRLRSIEGLLPPISEYGFAEDGESERELGLRAKLARRQPRTETGLFGSLSDRLHAIFWPILGSCTSCSIDESVTSCHSSCGQGMPDGGSGTAGLPMMMQAVPATKNPNVIERFEKAECTLVAACDQTGVAAVAHQPFTRCRAIVTTEGLVLQSTTGDALDTLPPALAARLRPSRAQDPCLNHLWIEEVAPWTEQDVIHVWPAADRATQELPEVVEVSYRLREDGAAFSVLLRLQRGDAEAFSQAMPKPAHPDERSRIECYHPVSVVRARLHLSAVSWSIFCRDEVNFRAVVRRSLCESTRINHGRIIITNVSQGQESA